MTTSHNAMTASHNEKFAAYCRKIAEQRRLDAGYSGSYDDGGARMLEEKVEAWEAGLNGTIPKCISNLHKEFSKTIDPEYQKYLELKKRFE
jgi:hypothetical protein